MVEISPNISPITINKNRQNVPVKDYILKIQPYFMYLNFNDTENLQGKGWRKGKENINQNKTGIEILTPNKMCRLYLIPTVCKALS